MINVAVFGYGTVGSGVVEVINDNADLISKRVGDDVKVKYILDLRDFPGDKYESLVTHDVEDILGDPEISIICETMGGTKVPYDYTKRALEAGKSVCTSNKEMVAAYGAELIALAAANNCNYLFEASVGGGIPIIRPINECLTAEKIDCIQGILNGTTNYMLTKMENEGAAYDDVLKEAQDKGYAERNPEADVEGFDACRKIAILSSLMYAETVNYEDIYVEGITKITPADFAYAKKMGKTIKLIAMSKETEDGKFAMVSPRMVGSDSPLSAVKDVFNAILVHSNMLDYSMYYGRGAGKLATASAVVGDVIEAAKNLGKHLPLLWDAKKAIVSDKDALVQQYFVRVSGSDKAAVTAVFGDVSFVECVDGEFAFVTEAMSEADYKVKAEKIAGILGMIRM